MNIFRTEIDYSKYFIVAYYLKSKTSLRDAAWNLAIGQSVGNPNVRNQWETDELFNNHSCIVLEEENWLKSIKQGTVFIAFPMINFDWAGDGVSHLLVNIMGGQLDIDIIEECSVQGIQFPKDFVFAKSKHGIEGIRKFTGVYDKPLLGAIVKPKTGISPDTLLDMVKELVDGGVNFIKEDEILSNPAFCRIEDRVPKIMNYLHDKKVVYSVSIHSDDTLTRAKMVEDMGGNSVHVNFWCGMGTYKRIRENTNLFIHFQKSGDKILTNTNHDYHIRWEVICKLAGMMGVDFIHAGMIGGYYKWPEEEVVMSMSVLHEYGVMPALSCGFHPGLTDMVRDKVGNDFMANVGGAIHGHPDGTLSGARAMRQAIDRTHGDEYFKAVELWGNK